MSFPIIVGTGRVSLECLQKTNSGSIKTSQEIAKGGPPEFKPLVMALLEQQHKSKFQQDLEWMKLSNIEGKSRMVFDVFDTSYQQDSSEIVARSVIGKQIVKKLVNIVTYEPTFEGKAIMLTFLIIKNFFSQFRDVFILDENTEFQEINEYNRGMNIRLERVHDYITTTILDKTSKIRNSYLTNPEVSDSIKNLPNFKEDFWIVESVNTNLIYKYVRLKAKPKPNKKQMFLLQEFVRKFRESYFEEIQVDQIAPFMGITRDMWDKSSFLVLEPIDIVLEQHYDINV